MIVSIEEIYEDEQPVSWIANSEKVNPELRTAIEKALALQAKDDWEGVEMYCNAGYQVEAYNREAVVKPPCTIEASITLYATGDYSEDLEELEFDYQDKYPR